MPLPYIPQRRAALLTLAAALLLIGVTIAEKHASSSSIASLSISEIEEQLQVHSPNVQSRKFNCSYVIVKLMS